ncbi:PilZ domain-containing protein [bacterium]|nr:PilZ domain-containing protein [bacterium]
MEEERRKFPRFETTFPVEWVQRKKEVGKAKMVDISRHGFRLLLNFPPSPGVRMNFKIHIPGTPTLLSLKGTNVWHRPYNGQWEAGFVFKKIRSSDKSQLLDYAYSQWLKRVRE